MAASCWPSSIMWWSLTMGALALLPRLLFHCGSRLHHWLPTSPGCPCSLRDEVPSLYPTTGSAFPMDMVQRSRLCRLVHPTAGALLFKHRTSKNSARTKFAECTFHALGRMREKEEGQRARPGRHCHQQCEEKNQDQSLLTATPAYPLLRLRIGARGQVDEDGTFGRVNHLCGDAPEPHPSDRTEISTTHGQ
jgi:hypothetical protein